MKNSPLSEELYEAIERMKYDNYDEEGKGHPRGPETTEWIHLQDAVYRGTIKPYEAWETLKLGYVAEHLKVRESKYSHLL